MPGAEALRACARQPYFWYGIGDPRGRFFVRATSQLFNCEGHELGNDALMGHATATGILNSLIRFSHSAGPVWCTEAPLASTATVTGMSFTSNS